MRTKTFLATLLVAMLLAMPAAAQRNTIDCGDVVNSVLPPLPEIASKGGILSGTLYTISQQVRMPNQTTPVTCYPQWVRAYSATQPTNWNPSSQTITSPSPGPTLRARVGDVVNLTFINVIDANKFPGVDDEKCDATSKYPGQSGDSMPNCFHGSVYTNLHYHGSHVTPNATGDNVFLQILPSPRRPDDNVPYITPDTVQSTFADFYKQCNAKLIGASGPVMWPQYWVLDPPAALKTALLGSVQKYAPQYVQANQTMIDQGSWPQYFVGAYPYCFQIPEYKSASKTSTAIPAVRTPHTHGAGSAEVREAAAPARPLLMGQSPGTHWYHAHKHGSTTINVQNGMTGVFIIEGAYDDALNARYGAGFTTKLPVMVVQQLGTTPGLTVGGGGAPGGDFAVNGKINPTVKMTGGSIGLFRIANNAGRGGMYFDTPAGLQWKQLAQDGVQFNDANYNDPENSDRPFLLASGNRADLLVKAPAYNSAAGANNRYPILVYNTIDPSDRPPFKPAAGADTLLTVEITGDGPADEFMKNAPAPFPAYLNDITDDEIKGGQTLTYASTPLTPTGAPNSQHTIDGKKFSGEVGASVMMNTAEEWKIVNQTYPPATLNQISHPFHIHVNPFQVTELFDPNTVLSSKAGLGKVQIAIDQTNNITTVTGSDGTKFLSEFQPGDWIWMNGSRANGGGPMAPGMVLTVKDDTTMTIDAVTAGPNLSGFPSPVTYVAAIPLYAAYASPGRTGQCVLDPNDSSTWKPCNNPVPKTNRIWWDVFSIPSGRNFVDATGKQVAQIPGYFKMRSRFVDYSGEFVTHCHILAHEDRGMMTNVVVTPLQSRYSHH